MADIQDSISDNRLHAYLQRYINKNDLFNHALKGIKFCGHTVLKEHNAVFVITNDKEARYSTLIRCHSAWSCPYCSPRVMAQKGTDIACAIDALATWYNEQAAMITFTLPHDSFMSCSDAYQILHDTWRLFTSRGRVASRKKTYVLKADVTDENKSYSESGYYMTDKVATRVSKLTGNVIKNGHASSRGTKNQFDKRAVGKKGEVRECTVKLSDPWASCRSELSFNHFVRVYEFTYGDNGWHPHIHMLAWVPKENLQRFTEYEDRFLQRWWVCAKRAALKYWNKKYPDRVEENKTRVESIYADYKMSSQDGHSSVYLSKDDKGMVIAQKSSHYISGWSGNMELTGSCNAKKAKEGHYTPFQMLAMSCANAAKEAIFMPLFIDYAITTKGHRRVEFSSRTGITDIIKKWKQSEQYIITVKKKFTDTNSARWKVVAWFDKEQWYDICEWDITTDEEIRKTILELARAPDPWLAIAEYVINFGVKLHDREHPSQRSFEANIYENKMRDSMVA